MTATFIQLLKKQLEEKLITVDFIKFLLKLEYYDRNMRVELEKLMNYDCERVN